MPWQWHYYGTSGGIITSAINFIFIFNVSNNKIAFEEPILKRSLSFFAKSLNLYFITIYTGFYNDIHPMLNRVKLRIAGLSYSPMQNGAFALLLAVDNSESNIRIPIVIGPAEAQSIAIHLEGVRSPRPMTHDLFVSFAQAFGVQLTEVFIYKFEDGIYSSEMTFVDGDRTIVLDSRTSDAVAIAMRARVPIYTTPAIVEECGIEVVERPAPEDGEIDLDQENTGSDIEGDEDNDENDMADVPAAATMDHAVDPNLSQSREATLTLAQLQRRMEYMVDHEDYEGAARVQALIQARTQPGEPS